MDRILSQYEAISYPKKLLVVSFAVVAALYLGYEEDVVPSQADLENVLIAARDVEVEIQKLQEVNKSFVSIHSELRHAEEEMSALQGILPEDPEIEALLAGLSVAAKQSGVVIFSFTPDKTKPSLTGAGSSNPSSTPSEPEAQPASERDDTTGAEPPVQPEEVLEPLAYLTPITIGVRGTFPQIVSFYDRALSLNRIIRLGKFNLTLGDDQEENFSSPRELQATSDFIAYSQRRAVNQDAKLLQDDPYGVKQRREKSQIPERKEFTLKSDKKDTIAVKKDGRNAE